MFFSKNKKITKKINYRTYKGLSENDKIKVLMNLKNRGLLRNVLATQLSESPFEIFSKSKPNLLELGEKFFEIYPKETLLHDI